MSSESFGDFLTMGHHGLYVWSAYGISLLALVTNVAEPLLAQHHYLQEGTRCLRREAQQ